MTKEIEIDPKTAAPVHDVQGDLDKIHMCLQQLKDGLLPPGGEPWPGGDPWQVPHAPYPGSPYQDFPYGHGVFEPDDMPGGKPLPPGNVTPVGLFSDTVLEPLVVSPVTQNVNQVLTIGFRLFEQYPFDRQMPYPIARVDVAIDTASFGGKANIGFSNVPNALKLVGFTDFDGIVRFDVIGLSAGRASLVATAMGEKQTVDFIVS